MGHGDDGPATIRPMPARALMIVVLLLAAVTPAAASPLDKVGGVLERAHLAAADAMSSETVSTYKRALRMYRRARDLLASPALAPEKLSKGERRKRAEYADAIQSGISMCENFLANAGEDVAEQRAEEEQAPIEPLPARKKGQRAKAWLRVALAQYGATSDGRARAAYAQAILAEAGIHALPAVIDLFEAEQDALAREGIHEALATLGTSRVANAMKDFATKAKREHWRNALDVVYRCVKKPEKLEKERPFQRAVRAFHWLKDEKLSKEIVKTFDKMGKEGVAALGEILFVQDIGLHDRVMEKLSTKKDGRAVPPLVFNMNRFKFDPDKQVPAHEALLKLGWYGVPELINRLDDKAAGIWISWTLRKISGEHMGTDKRKWHDWWKTEKKKHPEVFGAPEPRFGPVTGG